jgi:hypothetical protein
MMDDALGRSHLQVEVSRAFTQQPIAANMMRLRDHKTTVDAPQTALSAALTPTFSIPGPLA